MLRGMWVFHAESDVRLLMSRRFPTVEKKMQRLLGEDYIALPCDEDINMMFISEILHEEEDHYIPPGIPEPFHEDFQQGSFAWDAEQEAHAEKLWPMGPISSICKGKIWPVLFLYKKGFYLVTVVALEKQHRIEQVRALELPQITAAFAVLEDICDFIPASLTISDVAGISELQYYIRSAIPFGSPVNTNYHLLRMARHGFTNKDDETTNRSPAWKPYLHKGKSKLTLSIVETVNCTLYGKPEYEDECFIAGNVYCCADIGGIPEVCVPISFHNDQGALPEISVHNCAHVVGGIKAARSDSFKITCTPPTGPFVLCRYRFASSPVMPIRGFYQIKEMSPVEFRLLLQIQFHPLVGNTFWNCQVRLPFHHRGVIKSHDLKCTGGSFSLTDHGQSVLWNLNVRRPRGNLETNLLGELIFESPQPSDSQDPGTASRSGAAHGASTAAAAVAAAAGGGGAASSEDPFLHGTNCYAEVFLEVPENTLSGIRIDPKAVTVYPTAKVYGGVSVQKEVLTGKHVIWNMAGEVRGHHSGLEFDAAEAPGAADGASPGGAVRAAMAPAQVVMPLGSEPGPGAAVPRD